MGTHTLSDQLRSELLRRRLPRFYVHRVVREFDDHADDISAEGDAPRARLGDPSLLAQRFAAEYRARHFAGRHPWLVFLIAPIPCTILAAIVSFFVGFLVIELTEPLLSGPAAPWASRFMVLAVCKAAIVAPLMAGTWTFGRLAYRSGCGGRWFWMASLLQCLLGALTQLTVTLPEEYQNGALAVGCSFPPDINWPFLALPLLLAIGVAWHARRPVETPTSTLPA
jgi:hypothetical protein